MNRLPTTTEGVSNPTSTISLTVEAKSQKTSNGTVSGSKIWNYFFGSRKSSAQFISIPSTGEISSSSNPSKVRSYWFFSPAKTVRIGGFMGFGGKVVPKHGNYEIKNEQRTTFSFQSGKEPDSYQVEKGLQDFLTQTSTKVNSEDTPLTKLLQQRESFEGYDLIRKGIESNIANELEKAKNSQVPEKDVPWLMANNPTFLAEVRNKEKFTQLNKRINEISVGYDCKVRRQLQCLCTQNLPLIFVKLVNQLDCFKNSYFPDEGEREYQFSLKRDASSPALVTIEVTVTTKNASKLGYQSPERINLNSKKFDGSFTLSCTATLTKDGITDLAFNSVKGNWNLTPPEAGGAW